MVTTNISEMPITHIRKTVFVPHHNSRQVELQNVYHVPGTKKKLLSVSRLTDSGNYVLFGSNNIKVYLNLKVTRTPIMKDKIVKSIYVMQTETTHIVLNEAPTWWYYEISLPDSRKLEQEIKYKLEEER